MMKKRLYFLTLNLLILCLSHFVMASHSQGTPLSTDEVYNLLIDLNSLGLDIPDDRLEREIIPTIRTRRWLLRKNPLTLENDPRILTQHMGHISSSVQRNQSQPYFNEKIIGLLSIEKILKNLTTPIENLDLYTINSVIDFLQSALPYRLTPLFPKQNTIIRLIITKYVLLPQQNTRVISAC